MSTGSQNTKFLGDFIMTNLTNNEATIAQVILMNTVVGTDTMNTPFNNLFPNKFSPSSADSQKTKSIIKRLINKDFLTRDADQTYVAFTQVAADFNSRFDYVNLQREFIIDEEGVIPPTAEEMNKAYKLKMKPVPVTVTKDEETITEPQDDETPEPTADIPSEFAQELMDDSQDLPDFEEMVPAPIKKGKSKKKVTIIDEDDSLESYDEKY